MLTLGLNVSAAELSQPLREASELYRQGRLDEARILAESVQTSFPRDLEALLLLGRIEFDAGRLGISKRWFRLASIVDGQHPLIKQFKRVFEEIEHRRGPLDESLLPLPDPDKTVTADRFRRGWFGPNVTKLDNRVEAPPSSPPDSLGIATSPSGVLKIDSISFRARDALRKGWYLKAYLLFRDLLRDHPDNDEFKLRVAETAIQVRQYDEARKLLQQILAAEPNHREAAELLSQTDLARNSQQEERRQRRKEEAIPGREFPQDK